MKKFISKALITTMLVGSLSGLAFADMKKSDVNFFLEKIATTKNEEKKEIGITILENNIKNGIINVDRLKSDVKKLTNLSPEYKNRLEENGYTVDQALDSLDILKDMNKEDTSKLMDSLKNQKIDDLKEVVDKYNDTSSDSSSSSSSSSSSKDESKKEDVKKEDVKKEEIKIEKVEFKDIEKHWAKNEIEFLVQKKIINGESKESFNPDGKITRGQFTALIVRLFELKQKDVFYGMEFKDINANDWYYDSIKVASEYKLVNGTDKNTFSPNNTITREEMVTIIMRAIESQNIQIESSNDVNIDKFDDKASISTWSSDNINKALNMNIINGKSETTFDAKGEATRAESAVIIKRVYNLIKK